MANDSDQPHINRSVAKRKGKTRRLNQLTAQLLGPALRARGITIHRIITEWPHIAGDAALWSEPQTIKFPQNQHDEGTLTVTVRSGRGPEIQMLEPEIISRCNQVFGYRAISRIAISQTTGTPLEQKQAPMQPAPSSIKPDPETAQAFEDARQKIAPETSPQLRKALDLLGKSLSGHGDKKG